MKHLKAHGKDTYLSFSLNREVKSNKALYYNNGFVEDLGNYAVMYPLGDVAKRPMTLYKSFGPMDYVDSECIASFEVGVNVSLLITCTSKRPDLMD
jgi:hypothetical protein